MFYWRVDCLVNGSGYLSVFGLRYISERRPGVLIGRTWDPDLYDMSWWWPFRLVLFVRRFLVWGGLLCGGWE